MALEKFRQLQDEEIHSQESSGDVHTSMGAQMNMALNLLTHFMREIEDNDLYQKVAALKKLAERGVITQIAKRLQRIQKDLGSTSKKSRMTRNEAFEEIIAMANKYAPYYVAEESMQNEHETNAEVILSESFQP